MKATCNAGCHCGEQQYYPVCSHNDFMFFSPCMAGCLNETINDGTKVCIMGVRSIGRTARIMKSHHRNVVKACSNLLVMVLSVGQDPLLIYDCWV